MSSLREQAAKLAAEAGVSLEQLGLMIGQMHTTPQSMRITQLLSWSVPRLRFAYSILTGKRIGNTTRLHLATEIARLEAEVASVRTMVENLISSPRRDYDLVHMANAFGAQIGLDEFSRRITAIRAVRAYLSYRKNH